MTFENENMYAKRGQRQPRGLLNHPRVSSSHGVFRAIGDAFWFLAKCWFVLVVCAGLIMMLGGCEFIYLPKCQYDCQAAGGAAYGRGAQ